MAKPRAYGQKKTWREKLSGIFKRAAAVTVIGGATVGGPALYHYGTIEEEEVRVTAVSGGPQDAAKSGRSGYSPGSYGTSGSIFGPDYGGGYGSSDPFGGAGSGVLFPPADYSYNPPIYSPAPTKNDAPEKPMVIATDKGDFNNVASPLFHLKSKGDAVAIQGEVKAGKVYRVKSYGGIFGKRNVLDVEEITAEELAERREKALRAENGEAAPQDGAPPVTEPAGPGTVITGPGLSGATQQLIITAHGYDITLNVPAEVVDKIKVDSVTKPEPVRIIQPSAP